MPRHDKTIQDKTIQCKIRQDKTTRQDKIRQDKTKQIQDKTSLNMVPKFFLRFHEMKVQMVQFCGGRQVLTNVTASRSFGHPPPRGGDSSRPRAKTKEKVRPGQDTTEDQVQTATRERQARDLFETLLRMTTTVQA